MQRLLFDALRRAGSVRQSKKQAAGARRWHAQGSGTTRPSHTRGCQRAVRRSCAARSVSSAAPGTPDGHEQQRSRASPPERGKGGHGSVNAKVTRRAAGGQRQAGPMQRRTEDNMAARCRRDRPTLLIQGDVGSASRGSRPACVTSSPTARDKLQRRMDLGHRVPQQASGCTGDRTRGRRCGWFVCRRGERPPGWAGKRRNGLQRGGAVVHRRIMKRETKRRALTWLGR